MSIFVLKRENALQMPTSYVDIDRDEMEYFDGGHWDSGQRWNSVHNVAFALDGVITVELACYGIYGGVQTIGALMSRNAKGLIIASTQLALKWAKISLSTATITGLYSVLNYFTGWSIGNGIAKGLDRIDRNRYDNVISF